MRSGEPPAAPDAGRRARPGEAAGAPPPPPVPADEVDPNFLIVGVMKGGTSSLHWYLSQHPEVFVTPRPNKELHYFDQGPNYRAVHREHYRRYFASGEGLRARGESTPSYCFVPDAPPAIAEFRPSMKLLMMLRDPVDRAISHIAHRRRVIEDTGRDRPHGGFWEELMEDLRHPVWRYGPRNDGRGYHSRGHYHEQLRRLHDFFPPEQVLVVRLEDLKTAPEAQMARVTDFLGIDRLDFGDLKPFNANPYEKPETAIYEYLASYYRPHNDILTRDFGIRTDDWKKPASAASGERG